MGVSQNFIDELSQLKQQLAKVRLTHQETSFRFKREQQILKRLVTSLATACMSGADEQMKKQLLDVKSALTVQTEVTALLPKIAKLESTLMQQTLTMDKQESSLAPELRQGGEMLLRLPGLPAKLKRDLRDLLSFPKQESKSGDHAFRLLSLYERSIKIIASNPNLSEYERSHSNEQELLDKLSSELQTLITELDFEGEYGERLYDIRAKLLVGVNSQELLDLTLEILRLVVSGTEHERKASEKFLKEMNGSLSTQLKTSSQNIDQAQNNSANREEMFGEMTTLISRSQNAVADGVELESLKGKVNPMLSELALVLERLADAEHRERALIERMEHQKAQIKALHNNTEDYKKRLEEQSARLQQDPMTKVYNRSAFHLKLEHEYHRWIKNQHSLRIVLFDIDNFKLLNDQFGYTAGDKALKIIARTIKMNVSTEAVIARFGGEEFILMLSESDEAQSKKAIETVQDKVSKLPFKFKNKSIRITLSGASTQFIENDTPEEILDRVGRYLTDIKASGPNQLLWK
ncbi:GGDEF domain-containing protein [Vibrio viridaestus]|uniref:diguanylate cyclase n=1 Tax=Vibrio viridaestus TaxID=2487322 RepID=A0A3N9TE58_9VIBR|nr:GGDEF domain-containing protein [Vibrio viridaestus]RQW62508.1 GGDEF domain-containing protein [Vibrio viridaestus]